MSGLPDEAVIAAIKALSERTAQEPGISADAAKWHAIVALEAAAPIIRRAVLEEVADSADSLDGLLPAAVRTAERHRIRLLVLDRAKEINGAAAPKSKSYGGSLTFWAVPRE